MIKQSKPIIGLMFCLASIMMISGCLGGMIVSDITEKSGNYTLRIPKLGGKKDIINIMEQVGKELGYEPSGKSDKSITFTYESPEVVMMLVGSKRRYRIDVTIGIHYILELYVKDKDLTKEEQEEREKQRNEIIISVSAWGDYGAGGVKHAEKIANEFADKLIQRAN